MLCVIKSRACKKCGGNLSLECDIYGVYIQCIQCGANWNEKDLNLKPQDVETIMKAMKVRRPSPGIPVKETSTGAATKRLVVPFPKKAEPRAEKPNKQASASTSGRSPSRLPPPFSSEDKRR